MELSDHILWFISLFHLAFPASETKFNIVLRYTRCWTKLCSKRKMIASRSVTAQGTKCRYCQPSFSHCIGLLLFLKYGVDGRFILNRVNHKLLGQKQEIPEENQLTTRRKTLVCHTYVRLDPTGLNRKQ